MRSTEAEVNHTAYAKCCDVSIHASEGSLGLNFLAFWHIGPYIATESKKPFPCH